MNEINKLIKELPVGLNFIVDNFDDGIYLVGVYKSNYCPLVKKALTNPNEKEIIDLKLDCLTEFFKKFKAGYFGNMFN